MNEQLDAALAQLDDYVRGEESEGLEAYEEALFARAVAGAAPELAFLEGTGHTFRKMKETGSLEIWRTAEQAKALLESGARVLSIDLGDPRFAQTAITKDYDLILTRVPLDLRGARTLEAEVLTPDGKLLKTMPDIPFDPEDGAVWACCEVELAMASASVPSVTRVWVTDDHGRRELLTIPFGF